MSDDPAGGVRERLTKQGEETLGKLVQDLLENSYVKDAISGAFSARERAVQAQEVALSALNIPTAADIERLTRRVRSVSQRLEGIEDGVDRLDDRLAKVNSSSDLDGRLSRIEKTLEGVASELASLAGSLDRGSAQVARTQERLKVPADD